MSLEVNDRLKKLILPEDDEDETTDLATGEGTSLTKTSPWLSPKMAATSSATASGSATVSTETSTTSSKNGSSNGLSSPQPPPELPPPSVELTETGGASRKVSVREPPKVHLLAVLGVLITHTKYTLQETRLETLRWLMWLHQQLPKRVGKPLFIPPSLK